MQCLSIFLDSSQDRSSNGCNKCIELRKKLQDTLDEIKLVRLINEILQNETNVKHLVKHASMDIVNTTNEGHYTEKRELGTDTPNWIQVVSGHKKVTKKQKYPQLSRQVAVTNRSAPLCSPHNSTNGPCRNDSDTSQTSEEKVKQ